MLHQQEFPMGPCICRLFLFRYTNCQSKNGKRTLYPFFVFLSAIRKKENDYKQTILVFLIYERKRKTVQQTVFRFLCIIWNGKRNATAAPLVFRFPFSFVAKPVGLYMCYAAQIVCLAGGSRRRTTTHDHTRPRTTTHDRPRTTDHARPTTHDHARPRTTTNDHARPRTTTNDHERPRTTTNDHERPRTTTNDHERPTTHDYARPRTITHDHARPRTTTHDPARPRTTDHARPRTTTHDHARPRTATHDHARPRTTTHDHARPRTHTTTHDHARVVHKTAAIFVWGSSTCGATL